MRLNNNSLDQMNEDNSRSLPALATDAMRIVCVIGMTSYQGYFDRCHFSIKDSLEDVNVLALLETYRP